MSSMKIVLVQYTQALVCNKGKRWGVAAGAGRANPTGSTGLPQVVQLVSTLVTAVEYQNLEITAAPAIFWSPTVRP